MPPLSIGNRPIGPGDNKLHATPLVHSIVEIFQSTAVLSPEFEHDF